ncbi:14014_t:CDS:2 [Funneliformis caledonium]|uniref:14014_t:CDS:1 n=1 Tax=Funneliformis caledonium TaxID=1117310 RepID=A0A9N8VGE8_9GLOM|nr:14014_t:CDS:2 [Funneliformis caledonium]
MVRKQLPRGETSIPRGVVCFVCLKISLLMQKYLDRVYVYMIRPYSSIKKTGRTISSRTRNLIYCITKFNHIATDLKQPISEPYFCSIFGRTRNSTVLGKAANNFLNSQNRKIRSETTTVTQCSESQTPTPTPTPARKHHDNHHHHHHHNHKCNHHKPTKTVTITPTVTVCPDCCERGGTGFQNRVRPGGNSVLTNDTTPEGCCRSCLADPGCAQWAFAIGSVCSHNTGANTCVSPSLVTFNDSGIIRCTGEGCLAGEAVQLTQINSDADTGTFPIQD